MDKKIRELIVSAAYHAKHGHVPSALSIVEIVCALDEVMKEDDKFVLSKGHGCLAYYAYLVCKNKLTTEELYNFGRQGSKLGGHPDRNKIQEVYASTGSLGHGLPIAVGAAMARKMLMKPGKFYCLVGDGECNEGTIWESILVAKKHELDNLVCIVDYNNSQTRSLPMGDIFSKFTAFGCHAVYADGHSLDELTTVLKTESRHKPVVVIAHTKKGKGVKELENNTFAWHHRAPNETELQQFINEINEKQVCSAVQEHLKL